MVKLGSFPGRTIAYTSPLHEMINNKLLINTMFKKESNLNVDTILIISCYYHFSIVLTTAR